MSIVPTTLSLVPSKTGTMISDLVVPKAVRYRGSAATSPTFTVRPEKMAAPVSPLVIGNVGYSGALGPLQTIFVTTPGVVHVIKPDPPIAAGTPDKFSDTLKSGDPILRCGNEAVEVLHQVVALHEHVAHYAHYK